MNKILCWWFGCKPDFDNKKQIDHYDYAIPCKRCGAYDTPYSDWVGDTRHNRFCEIVKYMFFRKWFPKKCKECGKRYGDHGDCIPF